ncbi:capsular polysaccharide export protein HscB [Xenorhabdus vietnamensis]|uniref:Capsular polysaccharide export protein HscB n=1 Tax=Xenorhabdus vietnamensis TaxID=351656 RepID=A0A1Y2S9F2_9GAMM|nr:hypothetical protein [Xenorhabdus vietnamensis]OTA14787.1 capsular polysaccharide export protein HscB [Xenorhabdus vietnamensis]
MKKTNNILTLDPMYSNLHSKIASLYCGKKIALLSSFAISHYLDEFDCHYINKEIKNIIPSNEDKIIVLNTPSIYKAKIKHQEKRELNLNEIEYMSQFVSFIRDFLIRHNIKLVLLHNDLRWHHALTIKICKILSITYIVTEQGLFRPNTTILDPKGVNAFSSLIEIKNFSFLSHIPSSNNSNNASIEHHHNSIKSKYHFFIFLLLLKTEKIFRSSTLLKYQHNSFSIRKYIKRHINQFKNGSYHDRKSIIELPVNYIFVPLQLEEDTQILIHSNIKSNQLLIKEIEKCVRNVNPNISILFKKHPNDNKNYILDCNSQMVLGGVHELAEKAKLSITINSSAAIDIIKTDCPLILLGNSIYDKDDIAIKSNLANLEKTIYSILINKETPHTKKARKEYLDYLYYNYSLHGAGYSYNMNKIKNKLTELGYYNTEKSKNV